jgi:hypothetical protein
MPIDPVPSLHFAARAVCELPESDAGTEIELQKGFINVCQRCFFAEGVKMHPLKTCSAGLVMVTLMVAPFLYGGTTDESIRALSLALYAGAGMWLAALALERRAPRIPRVMLICAIVLFVQGWLMTLNAKSIFDRDFLALVERPEHWPLLPGSVDRRGSVDAMMRLGALLLLLLMITDLSRSTRWLRRFIYAMAFTGIAFAVFGIWQKVSVNALRIWPVDKPPPTAFGTFWYHGNAASFLNLTWPLSLTATLWAFQGQRSHLAKAFWTAGTAATLSALAMNSSKGGHLIAAGLAAVMIVTLLLKLRLVVAEYGWKQVLAFSGLVATVLLVLVVATDTATSASRWMEYFNRTEADSRLTTARICLGMLPSAGLFGFGPGTFIAIFQHHVAEAQIHQDAIWKFAHDDWLQYFVEWGFFGGAVWLVLWSLPVRRAAEHVWEIIKPGFGLEKKRTRRSRERWQGSLEALRTYLTFGGSFALAGVLVHAMMDFPLQIMSLQIYAFALAGMLVARERSGDDSEEDDA